MKTQVAGIVAAWLTLAATVGAEPSDGRSATAGKPAAAKAAKTDRAELEKRFAQQMSGMVLEGFYTDDAHPNPDAPAKNRYTILGLQKAAGDTWLIRARVQFGKLDATLPPLPLTVKWAGDTPVITVDTVDFPGIGKYTARVVVHNGRWAGTWNGADHGGHVWGTVRKAEPTDEPKAQE